MSRNVIYEIGRVRVWYDAPYTYFEIISDCKRLEAYLNALNEMPYLLQVLFDIFCYRLSDYLRELEKKRKELNAMIECLDKKIEDTKEKYDKRYVAELEMKKEDLKKRIEKIDEAKKFTEELKSKLTSLMVDLASFKGIVDKVWLGREW